jgi:hypothetical protein
MTVAARPDIIPPLCCGARAEGGAGAGAGGGARGAGAGAGLGAALAGAGADRVGVLRLLDERELPRGIFFSRDLKK